MDAVLLQQIINGLTLGSIYALLALGYTMVYGVLRMINFAHSEIFMVGAYGGLWALSLIPAFSGLPFLNFLFIFLFAMLLSGLLALIVERTAYAPLRHHGRLSPLISAIGVSIVLQNLVMLFVSPQSLPYPQTFPVRQFQFSGVSLNSLQIFIFCLALALMVVLTLFINRTKLGKAMQAVSQNHTVCQLMGINVGSIITLTFFIGGALGGVAGALNGMYYGSIKYNMGFMPGIKAFTAAVLGGVGNIQGAMAGGFILGILETLAAGYISSESKDVIAFVVLILMLIIKPSGLFGKETVEKV